MLFRTLITIALVSTDTVFCGDNIAKEVKPYAVFPVPFELPNRNDRSDQCWLRVEDVELTETVTIYCYMAQSFLRNFIHDYNTRKMSEDDVDVSLWIEEPRLQDNYMIPKSVNKVKNLKDWKLTTVWDPITRMRLYVTKQAVCRIIMYSREGMTNYIVNCEKFLYYLNIRLSSGSSTHSPPVKYMTVVSLIALFILGL